MNCIAILHGGPADNTKMVVKDHSHTIKYTLYEPISLYSAEPEGGVTTIYPRQAIYHRVSRGVNAGRERCFDLDGSYIPDEEVALYVFMGVTRPGR